MWVSCSSVPPIPDRVRAQSASGDRLRRLAAYFSPAQVPHHLQVHPELGRRAKGLGQVQGRLRSHAPLALHQLVELGSSPPELRRELALAHARGTQELREEYLAGMDGIGAR